MVHVREAQTRLIPHIVAGSSGLRRHDTVGRIWRVPTRPLPRRCRFFVTSTWCFDTI